MDEEEPRKRKKKMSGQTVALVIVLIIGIVIGVLIAQYVEPFVFPERAALVAQSQTIQTQNQLLKQQIDCLVNGIQQGRGITAIAECA
jgi:uncharacterized membrane-anchored protein YhcB (DUF1043 family)